MMNINTFAKTEFAGIIGQSVEYVDSLIAEGIPQNADGTLDLVACIAWKLINDPIPNPPEGYRFRWKLDEAMDWLAYCLASGAKPAKAVNEEAEKIGLSKRTLDRAKERLRIVSKKDGMSGGWIWELPEEC